MDNEKKFYITDQASIVNALNLMGDTYDDLFRKQKRSNTRNKIMIGICLYSLLSLSAKVNSLSKEVKQLKEEAKESEGE